MASFPTSPIPSVGSKDATIIPIIKTSSDGNYIKVRRKTTRARKTFELTYTNISYTDYATLELFFTTNQGTVFIFTHPVSGTTYNCVFDMDEMSRTMDSTSCTTSILLAEL